MAGRSNKQKTPEIGESSTRSLLSPPPTEARTRKQKASLDKPKLPELQEEQESPNEDSSSREESSDSESIRTTINPNDSKSKSL